MIRTKAWLIGILAAILLAPVGAVAGRGEEGPEDAGREPVSKEAIREALAKVVALENRARQAAGTLPSRWDVRFPQVGEVRGTHLPVLVRAFLEEPQRGRVAETLANVAFAEVERAFGEEGKNAQLKFYLLRLAYYGNDPKIADALFRYSFKEMAVAAKATFWQIEMPPPTEVDSTLELCENVEGKIARNVLYLQRDGKVKLHYVTIIGERLYCFAAEKPVYGKVFYLNKDRFIYRDGDPATVKPWNSRGSRCDAPEGMELPVLQTGRKNEFHWTQNALGTPAWAVSYITPEFQKAFPLNSRNEKGEKSPTPAPPQEPPPREEEAPDDEDEF